MGGGIRPGQAKAPWVGLNSAAPSPDSYKVMVEAADALPEYLIDKIVGAGGIVATTYDKGGGIEAVRIDGSGIAGAKVKVSASDTTADYLNSKIALEGLQSAIERPAGNELLDLRALPGYFDDFYLSKPFWAGSQALTSGDFTVDAVNHYLSGAAENNTVDWIRVGIEGDFDYKVKLNTNGATTGGLHLSGNSNTVTWYVIPGSAILRRTATGESNFDVAYLTTTVWLRVSRQGRTLRFWYRQNDTDAWILSDTLTKDLGYDAVLSLKSMTNGRVYYVHLWDNGFPERVRSNYNKSIPLTDGATITPDLRQGNIQTVTLGGNRTVANPTECQVSNGFLWAIRLRQDASPPRTVTWGAKYRWPGGIAPTLTAIANKSDYFLFAYNATDDKWDCIGQAFNL